MSPALLFIYNADSGLFNTLTDIAHKIFAPQTYRCNLCALTHSPFGMRKEWKAFLETLDRPMEFLHADELKERYGVTGVPFPAIFTRADGQLEVWLDQGTIQACKTLEELILAIQARLKEG